MPPFLGLKKGSNSQLIRELSKHRLRMVFGRLSGGLGMFWVAQVVLWAPWGGLLGALQLFWGARAEKSRGNLPALSTYFYIF